MSNRSKNIPVSKSRPCVICGGDHKCSTTADGLILCGRKRGSAPGYVYMKQAPKDDQFALYRRKDDPVLIERDQRWREQHPSPPSNGHAANGSIDWAGRAREYRVWLTPELRDELAADLGLPSAGLSMLEIGWCRIEKCWTFPEYDAAGQVIGINRRWKNGAKKVMGGGHRGLYVPFDFRGMDDGPILLPEGASNVLALRSMGLCAIGRPNNLSGVELLAGLLRSVDPEREIIVLGDVDPKPDKGIWPGLDGAQRTATALSHELGRLVPWCMPPDGAKDVRSWFNDLRLDLGCQDSLEEAGERLLSHLNTHKQGRLDAEPKGAPPQTDHSSKRPAPRRLAPYQPFPVHALPPLATGLVREAAAALGCDPGFIALPALAVLASAIGNTRVIRLKRGWTEPAIIWTAIVGDSGTLKSPAYFVCVGRFFAVQERLLASNKRDCAAYQDELAQWKSAKKEHDKGAGHDPGDRPDPPLLRRVIVSDTTIEKLAEILEDNPRGTLVARDELSGWIGSFTKYKGKQGGSDIPNWLELNRGGTLVVDRKTGERRTLFVKRAAASVTGGIQPGILAKALTADLLDSGLAARLLLCWPPRMPKKWSEAEVDPDTERTWSGLLDRLLALNFEVTKDGARVPRVLELSAEAKAVWVAFYDAWAQEQNAVEGELAAAYSKLEGYAARFALLHHVASHAAAEADDHKPIGVKSIEAGITLARWFAGEARRIYSALSESADERDARRLTEFIRARGGEITVKELQRSNDRKYPTADAAQAALEAIATAGAGEWIERPSGPKGGRPTRSLRLTTAPDETDETDETPPVGEGAPDETPDETPSGPPESREI